MLLNCPYLFGLERSKGRLIAFVDTVIKNWGGGIYAEISVKKSYHNRYKWSIEYVGGFPHNSMATVTFRGIIHLFRQKLYEMCGRLTLVEQLQVITKLRHLLIPLVLKYNQDGITGGIIANRRTTDKKLLRKDKISITSGLFQHKLNSIEQHLSEYAGWFPLELTPKKVLLEMGRHKSARLDLFQEMLTICELAQQSFVQGTTQLYDTIQYAGKLTDLITIGMILYGSGQIKSKNGKEVSLSIFLKSFLRFLNRNDLNVSRTINNIINSKTSTRIDKKYTAWLNQAIADILDH